MSSLSERIAAAYAHRQSIAKPDERVTKAALARAAGVKPPSVAEWFTGDTKSLSAEACQQAAAYLGVRPEWLAAGRGPMLATLSSISTGLAGEPAPLEDVTALSYGARRGLGRAPVIGRTMGGVPERIWDDEGRPTGITDEYAEVSTDDERAFLVRVEGDSMAPRYNPGEYALIEPSVAPELGDDVLVRLASGETLVKRLLARRNGHVQLASLNGPALLTYRLEEIVWLYYVAHPVPVRRIKSRL